MKKLIPLLFALSLVACTRVDTVELPTDFCSSQPTGESRTVVDHSSLCMTYKDGMCTFSVPTDEEYTEVQVTTTCQYNEWRRK